MRESIQINQFAALTTGTSAHDSLAVAKAGASKTPTGSRIEFSASLLSASPDPDFAPPPGEIPTLSADESDQEPAGDGTLRLSDELFPKAHNDRSLAHHEFTTALNAAGKFTGHRSESTENVKQESAQRSASTTGTKSRANGNPAAVTTYGQGAKAIRDTGNTTQKMAPASFNSSQAESTTGKNTTRRAEYRQPERIENNLKDGDSGNSVASQQFEANIPKSELPTNSQPLVDRQNGRETLTREIHSDQQIPKPNTGEQPAPDINDAPPTPLARTPSKTIAEAPTEASTDATADVAIESELSTAQQIITPAGSSKDAPSNSRARPASVATSTKTTAVQSTPAKHVPDRQSKPTTQVENNRPAPPAKKSAQRSGAPDPVRRGTPPKQTTATVETTVDVDISLKTASPNKPNISSIDSSQTFALAQSINPEHIAGITHESRLADGPEEPTLELAPIDPPLDPDNVSEAFQGALSERVISAVRQDMNRAEIRITPDELGPITIELSVDGDSASVVFSADQSGTRSALQESLQSLRDLLSDEGISLTEASVSDNASSQTGTDDREETRDERSGAHVKTADDSSPDLDHSRSYRPPVRQQGLVDLFA